MSLTKERIEEIRRLAVEEKVSGMMVMEGELMALCDLALAWYGPWWGQPLRTGWFCAKCQRSVNPDIAMCPTCTP